MKRGLLALLAGFGLFGGGASTLAAPPPSAAPPAWVRYAELVGRTLPAWLDEPTPAATRLRDYLDHMRAEGGGEDVVLPLSVWVAADGAVSRIVSPVFAQPAPNADLQAVFVGRKLSAPPPGLRLPLRLQLRVAAAPPAVEGAAPAKPSSQAGGRAW